MSKAPPGYSFVVAKWDNSKDEILSVREQVFGQEVGLSAEEYQDDQEPDACHVLVFEGGGRLVGSGRILPDGTIGYIAVLRPWRGYTVGGAILAYLLHIAKAQKIQIVSVKSLLNVTAFFEKNGFFPVDTTAEDKDLTLLKMVRSVNRSEKSASVH